METDTDSLVARRVEQIRIRVTTLFERDGVNHAAIRAEIERTVGKHVKVFRNEADLEDALSTIRQCREGNQGIAVADPSMTFNTDLVQTTETRNLIDFPEAITLGAVDQT